MKRIVQILIFSVTLLVAVHPVVAFHFCGGNLVDYSISSDVDSECCCTHDHDSKCDKSIADEEQNCCSLISLEMQTDNFINNNLLHLDNNTIISAILVKSIINNVLCLTDEQQESVKYNSPPDNVLKSGRDILVSKCVLTI